MPVKCESCGHSHDAWVPLEKLEHVARQRRESNARIKELEGSIEKLTGERDAAKDAAGGADALAAQLTELRASLEAERSGWETQRALMAAGFRDEGLDIAGLMYGRLPENDRPTVADWAASLFDGEETPQWATPWAPNSQQQPAAKARPKESAPASAHGPPTTQPYNADQIRNMSVEEYREHRQQILSTGGAGIV